MTKAVLGRICFGVAWLPLLIMAATLQAAEALPQLGNYQSPILQRQPFSIKSPYDFLIPNPQTLAEGATFGLVNVREGNLTFKVQLYPLYAITYDSRHSTFDLEYIHLHKSDKTAELQTITGYLILYERDKNGGSDNSKGQRYVRLADAADDYGEMWVKDSQITIDLRSGGNKTYTEDKRKKETGTDKYFVLSSNNALAGQQWEYQFDETGNLVSIVPLAGATLVFFHPSEEVMQLGLQGQPPAHEIHFNAAQNVAQLTSTLSIPGAHGSEPVHNTSSTVTYSFNYDPNGRLRSVTDSLGRTLLEASYNAAGRVTQVNRLGESWSYLYAPSETTISFSSAGGPAFTQTAAYETISEGTRETLKDCLGYKTVKVYNSSCDLIRKIDKNGKIWEYGYNFNHQLILLTTPLGSVWTYRYNQNGQKIYQKDPEGRETRWNYNLAGDLTSEVDALGSITLYAYDDHHRAASITDPENHTTTYASAYDGNRLLTMIVTDPMGLATTFHFNYDPVTGQELIVEELRPNGGRWQYTTSNSIQGLTAKETIDPYGHVINGRYDPAPCGGQYLPDFSYFRDARCDDCPDADDHRLWVGKDSATGLILHTRDQDKYETAYAYVNRWGAWHLSSVNRFDQPNFGTAPTGCGPSVPDWDRSGVGTDGAETRYEFNCRGDLAAEISPIGLRTEYTRDGNGNMIGETHPNGQTVTYQYDGENRLVQINYPDGRVEAFNYNKVGDATLISGIDAVAAYEFDALSRVTSFKQKRGDREETLWYAYTPNGRRQTITHGERIWNYSFDGAGRITFLVTPFAETLQFVYHPTSGLLNEVQSSHGHSIVYGYDLAERKTEIINRSSNGPIYSRYIYGLDANGMVVRLSDGGDDYVEYIPDNRLNLKSIIFHPGDVYNFSYDSRGNLSSLQLNRLPSTVFQYNLDDTLAYKLVPGDGPTIFSYDYNPANAAMKYTMRESTHTYLWDRVQEYAFDYRDLLAEFHKSVGGLSDEDREVQKKFYYLPGLRSLRVAEESERRSGALTGADDFTETKNAFFINDLENLLYEELEAAKADSKGGITTTNLNQYFNVTNDILFSSWVTRPSLYSTSSIFYLKDLSESVTGVLDENGALNYTPDYEILGKPQRAYNPYPILQNSRYYDAEMHQYFVSGMHYDPTSQTFDGKSKKALLEREYIVNDGRWIDGAAAHGSALLMQAINTDHFGIALLYNNLSKQIDGTRIQSNRSSKSIVLEGGPKPILGWCRFKNGELICWQPTPPNVTLPVFDMADRTVPIDMASDFHLTVQGLPEVNGFIALELVKKPGTELEHGSARLSCVDAQCWQVNDHEVWQYGNGDHIVKITGGSGLHSGDENSQSKNNMVLNAWFGSTQVADFSFSVRTYPKNYKYRDWNLSSGYSLNLSFDIESENGRVDHIGDCAGMLLSKFRLRTKAQKWNGIIYNSTYGFPCKLNPDGLTCNLQYSYLTDIENYPIPSYGKYCSLTPIAANLDEIIGFPCGASEHIKYHEKQVDYGDILMERYSVGIYMNIYDLHLFSQNGYYLGTYPDSLNEPFEAGYWFQFQDGWYSYVKSFDEATYTYLEWVQYYNNTYWNTVSLWTPKGQPQIDNVIRVNTYCPFIGK